MVLLGNMFGIPRVVSDETSFEAGWLSVFLRTHLWIYYLHCFQWFDFWKRSDLFEGIDRFVASSTDPDSSSFDRVSW